eukprot:12429211-Alexandrium_andersonii.AAC.1
MQSHAQVAPGGYQGSGGGPTGHSQLSCARDLLSALGQDPKGGLGPAWALGASCACLRRQSW